MNQEISHPIKISEEVISLVNQLMHTGFEIPHEKLLATATLNKDLGLDSLDAVDMLVYIEENLGVKIEGERLRKVKTLQDVYLLADEAVLNSKNQRNASEQTL